MTFRFVSALLPVIAAAVLAGGAQAATLHQIDFHFEMTRNGQPVPHSEQGTSRATPSDINWASSFMISAETTEAFPSFTITGTSLMSGDWEVQPEAGESEGDPVCYQYSHVAAISAESSGQAAAGVIIGGGDLSADTQVDEGAGTFSYDVDVAGAGSIDVEGVNVLSFGPTEIASGEAADFSDSGTFLTAIGESFSLRGSIAAAGAGVHPGSAEVQAASEFNIAETELADCFPAVDLSPNPADFNDQEVGTNSDPLSVTLENSGHTDLDVDNLTAPTAPFAAAGGTCGSAPFTLAPGDTCSLDYSFSPTESGAASQSITLENNALDAPHQFELQGNGIQAGIALDPGALDFGDREVDTSSETASVTVQNTGDADLDVGSITSPTAPFAAAGGTCGSAQFTLTPGATCTLDYGFSPTETGTASQSITLESNAPDAPHQFELQGNGIQAGIALDPGALDFGDREVNTSSETASVTVENSGDADLDVESITSPTAPFAAAGGTCGSTPFTLTPGATCTLDYGFSPTETGAASQSITLESNAPDAPHQFELQGNGTQAETILSLGDVDFGEHAFGTSSETRSITISNGGDAELVIDDIDNPEPPFEITGGSCYPLPTTITPGESCTIEARMSPTSWSGSFAGEILIFSNSPTSPDRVGLRGTSPAPLPVPMLGLPAAVLLILSIIALTRRWNHQRASGPCG